jgi:pSer/pThr/pTyr-binding forkhead associated (FHA) protein
MTMSPTYRLVLKSGPNAGQIFPLDAPELVLGREPSNDIVINDPEVSRRHARLYLQGSNYVIEDYGSTNGTSVSGQRLVGPYILRPGELITLGENTQLLFEEMILDPDATRVSVRQPVPSIPPRPAQPVYPPEPSYQAAQPEAMAGAEYGPAQAEEGYAGQVPYQPEAAKPRRKLTPIVIVLIVLVAVGACCLIGFAIFDAMNLYCSALPGVTNFFVPGYCP